MILKLTPLHGAKFGALVSARFTAPFGYGKASDAQKFTAVDVPDEGSANWHNDERPAWLGNQYVCTHDHVSQTLVDEIVCKRSDHMREGWRLSKKNWHYVVYIVWVLKYIIPVRWS